MDDRDFDVLVRHAGASRTASEQAVASLVAATKDDVHRHRRRGRRPLVLGALAAGSLLLTAGASASVLMMERAPFQGLEADVHRTSAPIPVDYTSASGRANHCLAFLELHDVTPAVAEQAEVFVRDHDWSGIGQRTYDSAARGATDPDAVLATMSDQLAAALRSAAVAALPIASSAVGTTGPAWNGFSMSCADGQW